MDLTFTGFDFRMAWPQISLVVFIVAILLVDLIDKKRGETTTIGILSIIAVGTVGIFSWWLWKTNPGSIVFDDMVIADNYSLFFNLVFCLGFILTALISLRTLPKEGYNYSEYYIVMMGALLGMMFMASAGDLIMVFIGIETLSISLYILAGFARKREESNEAAMKYLLLGAFATGFMLYGISLIYGATGYTALYQAVKEMGTPPSTLFIAGFALLLVGLLFKASLVPFHMWAPDVYQGAPTPIAAFMSTGAKAAAFAVLYRVLMVFFQDYTDTTTIFWYKPLFIISILSMTIGNITAIVQTSVKRMLAYSSIAHAGYLLMAILSWNAAGSKAMMFYLLSYTLMNMGAFGVVALMRRGDNSNEHLASFAGLSKKAPFLAAMMMLFMFALAGIPPTAGFLGKFLIFAAAVQKQLYVLVIFGVINAVISVYYYLRVIVVMYMSEPDENTASPEPVGIFAGLALIISAAGIIAIGIAPSCVLSIVENSFFYLFKN